MFFIWLFFYINIIGFLIYKKLSGELTASISLSILVISRIFDFIGNLSFIVIAATLLSSYLVLKQNRFRKKYITQPILNKFRKMLPKVSDTEQTALNAGTTWWDKELFSGAPDWSKLLNFPTPKLTQNEKSFLDNEVQELCSMIDNWKQYNELNDLPKEMWDFLKSKGFFGLIIPKEYGGHNFSALAHSEILTKISGRSFSVATTVAVPNSLGPAELLMHYGTDAQKSYYLPNLAKGKEIPCFALTSPEAGSDATSITDSGVISQGEYKGKKIIGIKLNWNKRYITLAPIATVLGLAFRLYDPENLIGDRKNIGITCALIPTNHPGVKIGDRHKPLTAVFQNGPTQGKDVFIPLDWIIGGKEMAGHGWKMLVECLSCGRAISLPSSASGGIKTLALTSGSYSKIRKQFKQSLCKFEGIQEPLARMAGYAYIASSATKLTSAVIDSGEKPSVIGAILKYQLTERGRQCTLDAMDIHGGKAIMMGSKNYIADHFINTPVAITVEGANILTRNLIVYGQGALRCHPYILDIIDSVSSFEDNPKDNLRKFDSLMINYLGDISRNKFVAFWSGLTFGNILHLKGGVFKDKNIRNIHWASAAFSFLSDNCLAIYGSSLKYREMTSARLADCLSSIYLASCCVKRFKDGNKSNDEKVVLSWCIQKLLSEFWSSAKDVINNIPNPIFRISLRIILTPLGTPILPPQDRLTKKLSGLISSDSELRKLLSEDVDLSTSPISDLEEAFNATLKTEHLEKKLNSTLRSDSIPAKNYSEWVAENHNEEYIDSETNSKLQSSYEKRMKVIEVN